MNPLDYEIIRINLKILLVLQMIQICLFIGMIFLIYLNYSLYWVYGFLTIFIYTHYEMNKIRGYLFENA